MQALISIVTEEIDSNDVKSRETRKLASVIFKNIVLKNIRVSSLLMINFCSLETKQIRQKALGSKMILKSEATWIDKCK